MSFSTRKRFVLVWVVSFGVGLIFLWNHIYHSQRVPSTASSTASSTIPSTSSAYLQTDLEVHICGNSSEMTDLRRFQQMPRKEVELFITISSAPIHLKRRNAIRETWASTIQHYSAVYRFFTDSKGLNPDTAQQLMKERKSFGDLEFTPTKGGYWLTHRFLHALFWAFKHYNFKFFLRIDDDYFVCLNHLMDDLKYRQKERFWFHGFLRCDPRLVIMDEGFLVFTKDIIQEIVRRNNSLCCHPFGDQMIVMFLYRLEREGFHISYFADNNRLAHYGKNFPAKRNFCSSMLGIHQAYPSQMYKYWKLNSVRWFNMSFNFVRRKQYTEYCHIPRGWDWRLVIKKYRYEPKACWEDGVSWPALSHFSFHRGREAEN